jgi:hypothetical protein
MTSDTVEHPSHYNQGKIECIEIARELSFNVGNCLKYVWRWQDKNRIEDLKKALWYARDEYNNNLRPGGVAGACKVPSFSNYVVARAEAALGESELFHNYPLRLMLLYIVTERVDPITFLRTFIEPLQKFVDEEEASN